MTFTQARTAFNLVINVLKVMGVKPGKNVDYLKLAETFNLFLDLLEGRKEVQGFMVALPTPHVSEEEVKEALEG